MKQLQDKDQGLSENRQPLSFYDKYHLKIILQTEMKRVLLSFALFLGMMATSNAQDSYTITSPDGKISVSVSGQNGKPQYSVSYDGKPIVA
ncbi:MAG: glycoside hydrolase family 97 N-terminal domain-containing protein, partial [Bacteroidales bacterium]|nr:glycoside hydrolase family 97 N-terminal domain-containing protein [Bacteroidales bacterium]